MDLTIPQIFFLFCFERTKIPSIGSSSPTFDPNASAIALELQWGREHRTTGIERGL
jgi:hypothetical protein